MDLYHYESPSIIRFLEPLTGDLFTVRLRIINEIVLQPLGGDKNINVLEERRELTWIVSTMSHSDHSIAQCDKDVR